MIEKKQTGIFWAPNSFNIIVTSKGRIEKVLDVPFSTPLNLGLDKDVPEDLRRSSLLQKIVTDNKISTKKVHLSLPTKDLIFRSFVIPFMNANEVSSVVDFEVTKYIPIKLEDLAYSFHTIPFTDNHQKMLRILFFAVRKRNLQKYIGILEHIDWQIDYIEPSPVSLVRSLHKQGYLSFKHSNVIIEVNQNGGKMIIVDPDVIQFVREFQLSFDQNEAEDLLRARLFNDIRVSLNFYKRQNPEAQIDQITTLSLKDLNDLPEDLSKEFNIPVKSIISSEIINTENISSLGLLSAYGICIRDKKESTKNFDLGHHTKDETESQNFPLTKILAYKTMLSTVALCSLIIVTTIFFSNKMAESYRQKIAKLKNKEGIFQSSETSQIEELKKTKTNLLTSYNDIRLSSDITFYLSNIPNLLPQGTWLKNIDLKYFDESINDEKTGLKRSLSRITLILEGYAYLKNVNEQIRLINSLIGELKNDESFSERFKDINLETVRQEILLDYSVTYFKITCR